MQSNMTVEGGNFEMVCIQSNLSKVNCIVSQPLLKHNRKLAESL